MLNTVAILGCGTRGMIYARELAKYPFITVTAICDKVRQKAEKADALTGSRALLFTDENEFFNKGKLADVLIIATQDADHYRHAMKALDLGYQLLLEKPVSPSKTECVEIEKKAKEKNALVLVCHVLRYTDFYKSVADIVHSGKLGQIVHINHTENIGYWHFAHSFVRGPWRNTAESCPLLMAKCCHDLDLLYWLMDCDCVEVHSCGGRSVFCASAMPKGASSHCLQGCAAKALCPFDAEKIYLMNQPTGAAPVLHDAGLQVVGKPDATADEMRSALTNGQYGRCVYKCDNDVNDHQIVATSWANGATAALNITAFTKDCYRRIHITGSKGELLAADCDNEILVNTFLENSSQRIPVADQSDNGHLGGDAGIIKTLVDIMSGNKVDKDYYTTIDVTMKSHSIAFDALKAK